MVKPDVQTAIMELIDKMDENQLLFTSVAIDSIVTPAITAKAANDLSINGATGKDVKILLTDANGARKILVIDSAEATVAYIDSNGVVNASGFVGNLTGNVIGDLTPTADLAITAASAKDVIVKLGDAVGAKKLIVKDSANAEQGSLNSDGLLTVKNIVGNLKFGTADTSGAPTAAEMASAFGAVTGQAGAVGVFLDSGAEGKTYLCICDGVAWHTIEGTVGV